MRFNLLIALAALVANGCSSRPDQPVVEPRAAAPVPVSAPAPKEDAPPNCTANADCGEGWICEGGVCTVANLPAVLLAAREAPEQACDVGDFTVPFPFNSAQLNHAAEQVLIEVASCLLHAPDNPMIIEGHCDTRGTVEYNLALGQARALSVRRRLLQHGAAGAQAVSRGELTPVCSERTEECHAKNRRVVFW